MTEEYIEKVASEYVREVYNGDTDFIDEAENVIQWLAKRYAIVEKEKVEALQNEIHGEIMCAHDDDDWQSAAHYILDVMPRSFNKLFNDTEK